MATPHNVDHYAKLIAKKHGLPLKMVKKILMFGMKNMCKCISSGQDIRIPKFGHIYVEKIPQVRGLLNKRKKDERK
jgi:nucleoid DNA-binding protein